MLTSTDVSGRPLRPLATLALALLAAYASAGRAQSPGPPSLRIDGVHHGSRIDEADGLRQIDAPVMARPSQTPVRRRDSIVVVSKDYDRLTDRTVFRYDYYSLDGDTAAYTRDLWRQYAPGAEPEVERWRHYRAAADDDHYYARALRLEGDGSRRPGYAISVRRTSDPAYRSRVTYDLDADGAPTGAYRVGFDSLGVPVPGTYRYAESVSQYVDSTTAPVPMCRAGDARADTTWLSARERRISSAYAYYGECAFAYGQTQTVVQRLDSAGRVSAEERESLWRTFDGVTGDTYVDTTREYSAIRYGDTTTTRTFRSERRSLRPEGPSMLSVAYGRDVDTYDDRGRATGRRAYRGEDSTALRLERESTYEHLPDGYVHTSVTYDREGGQQYFYRFEEFYRPLASANVEARAAPKCGEADRRIPEGIALRGLRPGDYRAYDLSGRLIWRARATSGAELLVGVTTPGVYLIRGPEGCRRKVAW